jgi:hypothetical protein
MEGSMSGPASERDVLANWAQRLAARVAPDEIDFAPDVLAAYLAGGAARRQLFAGPRADPGAFGVGLPLVLPHVIDALAHCYLLVKAFLGDPAVNSAIATANLVVALRQLRKAESSTVSAPEAEAMAGEVLSLLATDPSSATRFLDILGKSKT